MQIDSSTYDWLKELKVVQGRTVQLQNQKIMLGDDQAKIFQNGMLIGKIITQLTDNQSIINDIARLKNLQSPATRVYNWNIIQSCFKQMNFKLEGEIKSLIISGDNELLSDLLQDLYKAFKIKPLLLIPLTTSTIVQNNRSIKSGNSEQSVNYAIDYFENQQINRDDFNDLEKVDMSQIDLNKKLSDSNSLLEFVIMGLCKELNLKPKQAVSLLANNNKYLAIGLIKGLKTSFQPLCDWLQNVYVNIKTVMNFIEINQSDLFRFLDMIKPGLQSSSEQVSTWASRIILKISFEVSNTDILPQAYEWFVKENGGLQSCIFCLKRHKAIRANIVQIITQIAKYNLSDLFIVQMRKMFDDIKEYIRYVSLVFPTLIEMQNYKEELLKTRILDFWIEQSLKIADYDPMKNSPNDRQVALEFLSNIWIGYPKHISDNLEVSSQLLDLLKKASRDFSQVLRTHALTLLFTLLENFAYQKNPNTALIYKKLTFSLIENSSDINLREFILRNFIQTFRKFSSMPPDILLDPLIKQIQLRSVGNIFTLNICDIEFFNTISLHPGLNLKISIQFLDMLCKMYLNEIMWSQSLFQTIKNLIMSFIENEVFQEYVQKLSEVSLQIIRNSYKRLLQPQGRFQQEYITDQEQVIIEAQKRALIIELNKYLIELQIPNINNVQQDLLQNGIQYKGIYQLLKYFGDPDKVIEDQMHQDISKQQDFDYQIHKMQQNKRQKENIYTSPGDGKEKDIMYDGNRRVSESDNKHNYFNKSSINGASNDIDWGDAFESSTPKRAQVNNFTSKNTDVNTPTRQKSNTYGANRMDFAQFEQTNLSVFNQKEKEQARGRLQKPQDKKNIDDNSAVSKQDGSIRNRSISQKKVYANSLERRKDEIDQIREKRENKFLLEDLDRMQKQQKEQQLKKQTESEVYKIHTKLNVGKQKQTDHQAKLVYKENELNTIQNLNKYKIVNLEELEDGDKNSLDIVLKQYANTFKFVFSKYCNIHKMFNKKSDLFQEQKQASELISFADVWNICKDYDFQKFAQKDSVLNIMKQVNSNPQYTFLKYTDFVQFMIQLSIFMFSAPPKDLRGQPLGNQIKEMFKMMSISSQRRGENKTIFENPECYVSNLDAASIKNWNNKLLNDPNIPIPDNLKKVQEKQYILKNEFNQNNIIGLSQGYINAYKIVQDLFKEKFGINLGENTMQINNIVQVRPKPLPQMFQSGKGNSQSPEPFVLKTENNESTENPIIRKISQTVQITKMYNINSLQLIEKNSQSALDLRGGMSSKNADSKNSNQYQSLWVEKYSEYGLPGIQKNKKQIINQVIQDRIKKEEQQQKKSASQDKRLKERKTELEQKKSDLEAFKLKKKQEDEDKQQFKNQASQQEKDSFQQQRQKQIEKKNLMNKKKEEIELQKQKENLQKLEKQKEQELMKLEQRKEFQKKIDEREEKRAKSLEKKKLALEEEKRKQEEKLQNEQKLHKAKNQKFQEQREKKKTNDAQSQLKQPEQNQSSSAQQSQLIQPQLQQSILQQAQQLIQPIQQIIKPQQNSS